MGHTQRRTYIKHTRGCFCFWNIYYVDVERKCFGWQRGFIPTNSARLVLIKSELKDWSCMYILKHGEQNASRTSLETCLSACHLHDRAAQLSDRVHKAVLSSLLGAFKPIITPIGMSGWGAFTLSSTFPSLLMSFIGHQLPHWWHWGTKGVELGRPGL